MYRGTLSLVSTLPLAGSKQIRDSVPRNSNPAAALADRNAASISVSKSREVGTRCENPFAVSRMDKTVRIVANLTNLARIIFLQGGLDGAPSVASGWCVVLVQSAHDIVCFRSDFSDLVDVQLHLKGRIEELVDFFQFGAPSIW